VPELTTRLDDVPSLAIANERLTAQLAARVRELTRARAAVVEAGTYDRRALERDLHDGVQQDLLALGFDLRVAASGLAPDDPDRLTLEAAVAEVHAALDELRDISHGVYPPLLATRGLAAATQSLVRRRAARVTLGALPAGRYADAVERAAFAVLAEAVDRGATHLEAHVTDGRMTVLAEGSGPGVDGILPDMVAALGGEIDLGSSPVKAVIPCA
jgi:signal transduction histidine kinase